MMDKFKKTERMTMTLKNLKVANLQNAKLEMETLSAKLPMKCKRTLNLSN